MIRKINFNVFTYGYLLFLAVILIAFTPASTKPKQLLILQFGGYQEMKNQTELLFTKGWQVKQLEAYHKNSTSSSDFIVIYEK